MPGWKDEQRSFPSLPINTSMIASVIGELAVEKDDLLMENILVQIHTNQLKKKAVIKNLSITLVLTLVLAFLITRCMLLKINQEGSFTPRNFELFLSLLFVSLVGIILLFWEVLSISHTENNLDVEFWAETICVTLIRRHKGMWYRDRNFPCWLFISRRQFPLPKVTTCGRGTTQPDESSLYKCNMNR